MGWGYFLNKRDEFEAFYNETYTYAYAYAKILCKSTDLTIEIVQQAYYKAYLNLHKLKDKKKFKPWLRTIIRNCAMDFFKYQNLVAFHAYEDAETENKKKVTTISESEFLPEASLLKKEITDNIAQIIKGMNENSKDILVLYYHYGLSYKEISNIMEISIGTVKSRLSRSKEYVKQELKTRELLDV